MKKTSHKNVMSGMTHLSNIYINMCTYRHIKSRKDRYETVNYGYLLASHLFKSEFCSISIKTIH